MMGILCRVLCAASLLLSGCSEAGGDESSLAMQLSKEKICGTWEVVKMAHESNASYLDWPYERTYATFKEDGSYEGMGHFGEGKGSYCLVDDTLITSVDGAPCITYRVLSLQGELAEMEATLHTYDLTIWLICQKVKMLDLEPDEDVSEESVFQNEAMAEVAVAGCYRQLSAFLHGKQQVEDSIFEGKFNHLTPRSPEISELWDEAYSLLTNANRLLEALQNTTFDELFREELSAHLRAMRGVVAYYLAVLWGDVPYREQESQDPSEPQPPFLQREILQAAWEGLQEVECRTTSSPEWVLNPAAIRLFRAEIALSLGQNLLAQDLLLDVDTAPFAEENVFVCVAPDDPTAMMVCYTKSHPDLLLREARGELDGLNAAWEGISFGRWQMVNRTGIASVVTGCAPHHTLLPIPESELLSNPALKQNEGY